MSIDRSPAAIGFATGQMTALGLLSIIAGILGFVAGRALQPAAPPDVPLRLSLGVPHHPLGLALAPDGRRLAFSTDRTGSPALWVQDLSTGASDPLRGTDGATLPFWSADGRSLAFFADGKLRAFAFDDEAIHDLAEAPVPRGGVWDGAGDIVFAPDDGGLRWRRADGRVEPLSQLEGGETSHRHPRLVADGTHVIFFVEAPERTRQGIWIAPIDRPDARRRLINSDAIGIPIDRTLVYSSGGALVAQRLELDSLTLTGQPALIATAVGSGADGHLLATVAADTLIFGVAASSTRRLQWVDRLGTDGNVVGEPMHAWDVRLAPDGGTVAVARIDPELKTLDIWTYHNQRPIPRRISPDIDVDEAPAWSRDGTRLAWVSASRVVTIRDAQAARPDMAIRKFDHAVRVTDWAGEWIVLTGTRPGSGHDIMLVSPQGDDVRRYAETPFNETHGAVSPDQRWLAYASDESGQAEIYADAFPMPRTRARLSVGGGTEPRWSRDGRELYFRRGSEIHAARIVPADGRLQAVASERLFDAGAEIRSFDAASDGQRFLVNLPASQSAPKPLTVVLNVRALLLPAFDH